ncbi:Arginase [Purpureocillium takamizusanense]|uniref:Arginase n=1 Tax=Purpureocillium takamizusanense TaxID=2060973 RepID=A0A9Q8VA57_9HYPO|nr:Arginase [Purpureocillium takamizusanense]UNI17539.1 Arginase [Purpureocillium takamizusanense]
MLPGRLVPTNPRPPPPKSRARSGDGGAAVALPSHFACRRPVRCFLTGLPALAFPAAVIIYTCPPRPRPRSHPHTLSFRSSRRASFYRLYHPTPPSVIGCPWPLLASLGIRLPEPKGPASSRCRKRRRSRNLSRRKTRKHTSSPIAQPASAAMNTSAVESKFLARPDELGIVAVGFSGGQPKAGVDAGPAALIESGLLGEISNELGYKIHGDTQVNVYKDLAPEQDPDYRGMKNPLNVSAVNRKLQTQVYEHAREGRLVLTLGGDHSVAIGTIAGSAKAIRERLNREIAVIWVDAHADINRPEDSDSGNIHGMPLAFATGLARDDKEEYFGWITDDMRLSVKKLVYIGLRDVDAAEKRILRENGIKAFSMFDVDRHGIGRVMEMALAHIGSDTPVHLSFDVDALDPMWAPSTGTPVRGGLTLREGDYICECVHQTGQLVAIDLVEVNPALAATEAGAQETVRAGCSLVRCALGDTLL